MNNNIIYSLVKSKAELKEAVELVYQEYVEHNYINPLDLESRNKFLSCNLFPSSVTFAAKDGKKIIGTVSIIADSKAGLPMDEIYKKELDKMRAADKKIAEVGRLAIRRENSPENSDKPAARQLFLFLPLFKLVLDYGFRKKFNNLCIAINPKHDSFYTFLSFEDIGGLKYYPSVNNAPALAKTLNLNKIKNFKEQENYLFY